MERKGIDISKHQGKISAASWADIKDKCEFIIIRLGYRGSSTGELKVDPRFQENLAAVKDLGIPYGVYFFSQAKNAEEGREEADMVADYIDLSRMVYPAFIDSENGADGNGRADLISKNARTDAVQAFCERIRQRGGKPGIYAGYYWLRDHLHQEKLTGYDFWVPCYRVSCLYKGKNLAMWQTDSENSLRIKGFGNHLDCNICYKDYTGMTSSSIAKAYRTVYIKAFQRFLNAAIKAGLSVDGIWGPKTKTAAVKMLQTELNKRHGAKLAVDGKLGPKTKKAVETIERGDRGNLVFLLQGVLYGLKCDPKGFDGSFGVNTEAAVKALQKAEKITVDGVAGPETWAAALA